MRLLAVLVLSLGLAACASILGIRPRSGEHPFEHRAHVLKGVPCLECHRDIRSLGATGPMPFPPTETCVRCHAKPHDTRACSGCHGESYLRHEAALAREHLRFTHAEHMPRVDGQCVPCHAAVGRTDAKTLRPPMAQCFTCHQHKDQWTTNRCDGCHVDLSTEGVKPSSHVIHDGDFIREHGIRAASARELCATCHTESTCLACHGKTVPALPWRFEPERPKLAGLHRAGFRARHEGEARANPGLCATCHEPTTFCADCHADRHVGAAAGSRSPHPPGWVRARGGEHGRAARVDPVRCAGCHGGAGEALCVGCHRVGGPGGNPHGPGFSSRLEKTRDPACLQCHAP